MRVAVLNQGIGEHLPAQSGVTGGCSLLHREAGIEQQYPLARPAHQTAAWRRLPELTLKFGVHIPE